MEDMLTGDTYTVMQSMFVQTNRTLLVFLLQPTQFFRCNSMKVGCHHLLDTGTLHHISKFSAKEQTNMKADGIEQPGFLTGPNICHV
jgi:hypothetical protein